MAPAKTKRASGFTRARTGCKTCRRRKLKCDESKPGCKQCQKSKLDCEYAQGLTFRHQQNAGIENEVNNNYLSKFYQRNAATFTPEQKGNFVELPDQLQWAPPVTNPYARGFRREQALFDSAVDNTHELAAHSLNVLADAAQQPSYQGVPPMPLYTEHTATSSHLIDPSLQAQPVKPGDANPAVTEGTEHAQHNEGMSKEDASVAQMLKTFSGAKAE